MRFDIIKGPALLALMLLLGMSGQAHAQWRVTDTETQRKIDQLKKDANDRLEQLREQQNIGGAKASSAEDPEQPTLTLDSEKLSAALESEKYGEDIRCPQPGSDAEGPRRQWQICKEIVKTELARYQYALAMREVVIRRQQRLHEIENSRAGLNDGDAGRLHSNNNQMLALQTRLEVDRQQYRTYMDAYDARITYLQALRFGIGEKMVNGSLTAKDALISGGVLAGFKTLLNLKRSEKNGIFND